MFSSQLIAFLATCSLFGYSWSQYIQSNRRLASVSTETDLVNNDTLGNDNETASNLTPLPLIDICRDNRILSRVGDGNLPELLRLEPSPYCVSKIIEVYRHQPGEAKGEDKHYIKDGLKESDCLVETNKFKFSDTWIIFTNSDNTCDDVNKLIRKKIRQMCKSDGVCFLPKWKIIQIDYSDTPNITKPCWEGLVIPFNKNNESIIPASNLKFYRRSMVVNRTGFMKQLGSVKSYDQNPYTTNPIAVYHIPYGVRSDMVLLVNEYLAQTYDVDLPPTAKTPLNPVWISNRTIDVRYFWFNLPRVCKGECDSSQGRSRVSVALRNWRHNHQKYNIQISLAGEKNEAGRQYPSKDYMDEMLHSKIVVVAQRDSHEDMYRLMEAMASGALVFSDPMLFPPKWLVDGEHYIVYWSESDLTKKLDHYLRRCPAERLRIANNGWNLVMQRYRSFHMMEDVVFGDHDL
mmetsp:Transcript_13589/g.20683  ORF Transcript_13589/g.20683 Transcript_13589/m.20683 type:complete len:460 (-) Transcript_13589:75-1454(-)